MPTKLLKPLKREIIIKDQPYIVTLSPEGLKITAKGKRKGQEMAWDALVVVDGAPAAESDASAAQE
jgi:hypothetical protein